MLLLTLRGTPTLYNGDEIGMQDVPIPPALVQDPFERNVPGIGLGRDPERTPLQWDASAHAGFSTVAPWLPLAENYQQVNVDAQRRDARSMLTLHRELIAMRRSTPALALGSYRQVYSDNDLLVYERALDGERRWVALNLSHSERVLPWHDRGERVVLSTHLDRKGPVGQRLELRADEGVVLE
jgi:alpha-glucosidase